MARRAGVRYWATRGTWMDESGKARHGAYCTTLKGKQYVLAEGPDDSPSGPTFLKATKAFGDLYILVHADKAGDRNTGRIVCEYYLRDLAQSAEAKTLQLRQKYLAAFCTTEMGDWPVSSLTPFAVQRWISVMREPRRVKQRTRRGDRQVVRLYRWGDGSVRLAIDSLQAAFNYAVRMRLIPENPIRGLVKPSARSRGRECIVSPDGHELILARVRGQLRELIVCLECSGCRPSELLTATAADWDDALGAVVYHGKARRRIGEGTHKTARKDKERRIFFAGEALRLMRERVRRYPRGPLWRKRLDASRPYTFRALRSAFESLARRLEMPGFSPYSYRHTFATRWLEGGGSIDDLAAMLGNTPAVIRQHYAHLTDNLDRLKGLAEKFNAARSESPPATLPFGRAAQ